MDGSSAANCACRTSAHCGCPKAVYSERSRCDSTTVVGSLMTACTCCAASAGSPSCDHSSSAVALSDWVIVWTTSSRLPTPARTDAIANGTLIVDHATPVDQVPNDARGVPSAAAMATPTVANGGSATPDRRNRGPRPTAAA